MTALADAAPRDASALVTKRPQNVWIAASIAAALFVAVPWVIDSTALSVVCQIGIAIVFSLSYNVLLGQTGVLSFGHSLYSGCAGFFTAHAMNMAAKGELFGLPVALMPLVGAVCGAGLGVVFGYVASRRHGMAFAMITLGTAELVHAASLMFNGFFGGESGVTTNRMYGAPLLGLTFGPQSQVYYLILAWGALSVFLMYQFRLTPLGRMAFALRDNPERTEFIGYDSKKIRYLTMIVSCIFAGIAGSLAAINFEIVTHEGASIGAASLVLVYTFIGGTTIFYGPIIGAVVGTLITVVASGIFTAWYLYLGLFFIAIVVWAPTGLAGLLQSALLVWKHASVRGVWSSLAIASLPLLTGVAGFVTLTEMLYHRTFIVGSDTGAKVFGLTFDTASAVHWCVPAGVVVVSYVAFRLARRPFEARWNLAQDEVNAALREEALR
ncbi:MAG TPA: branched-chain amino acid ABC transporter permease [Ramlibacter sp.]|uniref:branched-chain amino acid ABC transporter permease n=1 Tax=Ramlibacter sp. TaxID=1917967 RepID=UPI002B6FCB78|nr:branched-chain amino acid ABC transporter permease [Ramlibacter sp.]HVZ45794.1 branched-chain amino acid ABC transporter permease [Ramlibacter sp.]